MNDNELSLVVVELKNRIGTIVSQYEEELARVKAQATLIIQQKDNEIKSLTKSDSDD